MYGIGFLSPVKVQRDRRENTRDIKVLLVCILNGRIVYTGLSPPPSPPLILY